jgi:hypothetical protein
MGILRARKVAKDGQKLQDLAETKLVNIGKIFQTFVDEINKAQKPA